MNRVQRGIAQRIKRVIDVVGAAIGLVVLSSLFLVVALVISVYSRGPVFFRQERVGLYGKHFRLYKFRTMVADAEAVLRRDPALHHEYVNNGYKLPAERDPRITPIGRFLRKTSLDELPQLINVLRGEMSLVGPRPLVPAEVGLYGTRQRDLLSVRPGITGYWQVSGRSEVGYPERCDLELQYVYTWSLWLDFRILALTIPAVAKGRGAY